VQGSRKIVQRSTEKAGPGPQRLERPDRPAIRSVGVISRPRREELAAVVPPLLAWLEQRGIQVACDAETVSCMTPARPAHPREDLPAISDMLIVLGGDGTLLAAARLMTDHNIPVLPVNLGSLGFLTSVTLEDMYGVLEQALYGQVRYSERIMIEAQVVRKGQMVHHARALNDAVLNKAALSRIIDLQLSVDGEFVCEYKADGLIISTPTGSTAYSLAAGGPIVYPQVPAFIITPICPHTLTNRPLVLPDTAHLEVIYRGIEVPIYLTLDGQVGFELMPNDRIGVVTSPERLRVVRPLHKTYFSVLRDKLKWGER
jgi:NAD+ kinase